MSDAWQTYFEQTKNIPPRPLLLKALTLVRNRDQALDLGSGALNDARYILESGFSHVVALDKNAVPTEIIASFPQEKFTYIVDTFESHDFQVGTYDLINAQLALPFISPEQFNKTWSNITNALKVDGIFVGQFFGDRDEWANRKSMTFHTLRESKSLLSGFNILSFEEKEFDRLTANNEMRHWHILNFIIQNKGNGDKHN